MRGIIYFEINLKIRSNGETMDRTFSECVIDHCIPLQPERTHMKQFSSWLSTVELAYTPVHYAVEATIGVNVLKGPRNFYGSLTELVVMDPLLCFDV